MAQQYKIDKVNYLKDFFENNENYIFNNYSGLNVEKITDLRNKLRELDSKFVVVKNNFVKRILKEKDMPEEMGDNLFGTTAIAFAGDNVNEILKVLFKFEKESSLKVKGGWVNDSLLENNDLLELSKLPGRDQLIAIFMSTLNAPLQNFVYACNDVIGRFVRVLNAVGESKK
jgi:large subunit ribosomal protein L10